MWEKVLANTKLIVSTFLVLVTLGTGAWTLVTNTFLTRAEAEELYSNYSIEIAYNKAFRLETRIMPLERIQTERELSYAEKKELKRLKAQLGHLDKYIIKIERDMFKDDEPLEK